MPKYIGTKFFEHDSSVFVIDTSKKEVFGISTERVTRIKHDSGSILRIKKNMPEIFNDVKFISNSFELNHREYAIDKLHHLFFKELIYDIYQPEFIIDNTKIVEKIKGDFFFKSSFFLKSIFNKNFYYFVTSRILSVFKYLNKDLNSKLGGNMLKSYFENNFKDVKMDFVNHHLTHALSAYYFSHFFGEKSLVLTLDGKGEMTNSTLWMFKKNKYYLISRSINYERAKGEKPETLSLGIMYSVFTQVLGFYPLSDEGKTEALAAFGKLDKKLFEKLNELFVIDKDNLTWEINNNLNLELTNEYLSKEKNRMGRENFAATIQKFLEKTVLEYLDLVYDRYKVDNICLSGGVIANVILNLNIFEKSKFQNIYIFPAMGDDGSAVGAAIYTALENGEDLSWLRKNKMPYWGPEIKNSVIKEELDLVYWKNKVTYKKLSNEEKSKILAKKIASNKIVSLVQGKMEFGPRALGNRSILANPCNKEIQKIINSKVKKRPEFQPFCPSILEEERERLFEKSYEHKHMAIAFRMKNKYWQDLPSAIHIDGTARPQFVEKEDNEFYYELLQEVKKITGYGVLINTSFNLHGRTIVRTASDALRDFVDCNIDAMLLGDYLIERKELK